MSVPSPQWTNFDDEIMKLYAEAILCHSEQEAVEIARQIQRLEELRKKLLIMPPVGSISAELTG